MPQLSGAARGHAIAVLAAALALGGATGCRDEPARPPVAVAPGGPRANLIAPGGEPTRLLRYALTVGTKQRLSLTMHLAMKVEAARSPIAPMTSPGLRVIVELEVVEATPGGGARCTLVIADADLADLDRAPPALVAEMRKGLPQLTSARGTLTIEPGGAVRAVALDVPATLGNELGQFVSALRLELERVALPLPAEAIGLGASWEVAEEVEEGGIRVRQKTLYELVALDGNRAKVRLQISQTADRQKATLPGLPPGVTTEIVAFDSAGGGEVELDLGRPAPVRQRVEMTTGVSFRLLQGTESQAMSLSSDSRLELDTL